MQIRPGTTAGFVCVLTIVLLSASIVAEGQHQTSTRGDSTATVGFSQPVELEGIVVRASRIPLTVLQIPAAATVIDLDRRTMSAVTSSREIVANLPGLRAYPAGNRWGQSHVDVRGFAGGGQAEYLKVTYDGIPINRVASGFVNWSTLDPAELSRIEAVTGPASAQFGDFGFGGMVALSSSWLPSERQARLSMSYGSDDAVGLSGQLTRNFEKGRANLFFTRRHSDGFRQHNSFDAEKIAFKFQRSLTPGSSISGLFAYTHTDEELPGAVTEDQLAADRSDAARDFMGELLPDRSEYKDVIAGLAADFSLADGYELNIQTYLTSSAGDKTVTLTAPVDAEPELLTLGAEASLGLKTQLWGRPLQMVTGSAFQYGRLDANWTEHAGGSDRGAVISSGIGQRTVAAWYVHSLYYPLKRLSLSLGLRIDHTRSEFDEGEGMVVRDPANDTNEHTSVSPKVAVGLELAPTVAAFASVSGAFKSPTLLHLYDSPPYAAGPEYYMLISNGSLEPQKGTCYEVGAKLINPTTKATATCYYYDITNEIDFDMTANSYDNIGKSRHQGVELSLWKEVAPVLSAEASLAVNSATFRGGDNDGNQINGVPRYRYGFGLAVAPFTDGFIGIRANGQSDQWLDEANDRKLDKYLTVALTAGYQFRSFDFGLRLDNLFDREYSYDGYVGLMGESRFYPALPRSVMVTLSRML